MHGIQPRVSRINGKQSSAHGFEPLAGPCLRGNLGSRSSVRLAAGGNAKTQGHAELGGSRRGGSVSNQASRALEIQTRKWREGPGRSSDTTTA